MQGPFLLCLCQRGAFTDFQMIFLFSLSLWAGNRKPRMTTRSIDRTSRYPQQANREKWFYSPDRTHLDGQIKPYFLAGGLPSFTLSAMFFSVGDFFFTDFSFEVFCLIWLYIWAMVYAWGLRKNKTSANRLDIIYDGGVNLYNMRFYRKTFSKKAFESKTKDIETHEGIYCDMLEDIFTMMTGLYTHFWGMGGKSRLLSFISMMADKESSKETSVPICDK